MITNEQKERIRESLEAYVKRYPSQNKAVNSLKGTSAGTVSSILNRKWDLISDDMWMKLAAQLDGATEWRLCHTAAFDALTLYMQDAKEESNVMWVTGPAGIGKSTAAAEFRRSHRNVFLMTCSEDMHKSDFIRELAAKVGVRTVGLTVRETLHAVIDELVRKEEPLLIFDEGDKLTDTVLYYYISLYNALEDKCGMIFLSTNYIQERMRSGLNRGRKGYDEIDSRICRRFVPLDLVNSAEVEAICRANGLLDSQAIRTVREEAASCGNDLRRVKKSVHKELRKLSLKGVQKSFEEQ